MRGQDDKAAGWAASALGWWEEAGVDTIVGEEPRDWLAPKAKAPDAPPPAPPPDALPDTLDGFAGLAGRDRPAALRRARRRPRRAGRRSRVRADDPHRHALARRRPDFGRGRRAVRQDARRDRPEPRDRSTSPPCRRSAPPPARSARRKRRGSPRSPATISASSHPGRCCCSAMSAARRWSARRSRARARAGTRSRPAAGPIRTLVTLRPEKLLTQPKLKSLAWDDLQMLMEELAP